MSLCDRKGFPPDTFAARDLETPKLQNPVDSLTEYSANLHYSVEMARRRKHRTKYRLL